MDIEHDLCCYIAMNSDKVRSSSLGWDFSMALCGGALTISFHNIQSASLLFFFHLSATYLHIVMAPAAG